MDKREFNVRGIPVGQAPKDSPVTVKGWVRTRRDSKAGISFVHLSRPINDGLSYPFNVWKAPMKSSIGFTE